MHMTKVSENGAQTRQADTVTYRRNYNDLPVPQKGVRIKNLIGISKANHIRPKG